MKLKTTLNLLSKKPLKQVHSKNIFVYSQEMKIQTQNINKTLFNNTLVTNFLSQNILHNKKKSSHLFSNKNAFTFCTDQKKSKAGPLKAQQIPKENLEIVQTEDKVENQDVQVFHAKGTLSILDKVPGVKHEESGQLYVLMFTCGQCNAKQIRSFTKNAYHKGVVLVRCGGCEKVHLVADNLGWFEDEPANVETLHQDKVKKVHDPAAISMFLQRAFSQQETLLKNIPNGQNFDQNKTSE